MADVEECSCKDEMTQLLRVVCSVALSHFAYQFGYWVLFYVEIRLQQHERRVDRHEFRLWIVGWDIFRTSPAVSELDAASENHSHQNSKDEAPGRLAQRCIPAQQWT